MHFYGIPFLEPALVRHLWPDAELRSQRATIEHVMGLVRGDLAERGGRSVAIAHCFAAGVEATPGRRARDPAGQPRRRARSRRSRGPTTSPSVTSTVVSSSPSACATRAPRCTTASARPTSRADRGSSTSMPSGLASVEWLDLPVPRRLQTIRGVARRAADRRALRRARRRVGLRAVHRRDAPARPDAAAAGAVPVLRDGACTRPRASAGRTA